MKTQSGGRRTKKNFIRIVEAIANEAVDSDLSDQFVRSVKGGADEISAFLGCNRIQSVLFSVICNLNFSNKTVSGLIGQCVADEITFDELWREITDIEKKNSNIEFLREVKRLIPDRSERILFIHLCDEYYAGNINPELIPTIRLVTPDERRQLELRLTISNGNSPLVQRGLLETRETFFRSEPEVRLSPKAVELLFRGNKNLAFVQKKENSPELIISAEIKPRKLFYNSDEHEKLGFVEQLLQPENYTGLIKRLERSGNKTGIAMLFSGPPGTGKTESVYQIARKTARDIWRVNISETKSKWFGESERLIKEVFDRYRDLGKDAKIKPILLFNEADGIFSTRKQMGDSSADQTENAIQNIILQELEDLDGILIATTNMTQNLDKAFDRRFLYKIQFGKPVPEARVQIWKNKIPSLAKPDALKLAKNHDFSGGQIDNIARKFLTHNILKGKPPTLQQIEAWCQEESNIYEIKKIGYKL